MQNFPNFSRQTVTILVTAFALISSCDVFAQDTDGSPELDFGIYSSYVDDTYAKSIVDLLKKSHPEATVEMFDSLEKAGASKANVLILAIPRTRQNLFSENILEAMKKKKAIGIGYGSAQLFGKLGLEINGGACMHFSGAELTLRLQNDDNDLIIPYAKQKPADNFGMYLPATSDLAYLLKPIARLKESENYAPIVRQGNYVMIGLSAHPEVWSQDYQKLFGELTLVLTKMKRTPFSKIEHQIAEPGTYTYHLAKGRSKKALFSKSVYFKFEKPTRLTATLNHSESKNMMLLFMGEKDRLHWTRKDAKDGEPLTIIVDISAKDIRAIGDQYWRLRITNFDQNSSSECTLKIEYDKD